MTDKQLKEKATVRPRRIFLRSGYSSGKRFLTIVAANELRNGRERTAQWPDAHMREGTCMGIMEDTLFSAVMRGATAEVKELLAKGAEVNMHVFGGDGWTPLHAAAWNGNQEIVATLLANGADVNMKAAAGWTPLHAAAWNGNKDTVATLIANGAQVDAKNNDGWTALLYALKYGHSEAAAALKAAASAVVGPATAAEAQRKTKKGPQRSR